MTRNRYRFYGVVVSPICIVNDNWWVFRNRFRFQQSIICFRRRNGEVAYLKLQVFCGWGDAVIKGHIFLEGSIMRLCFFRYARPPCSDIATIWLPRKVAAQLCRSGSSQLFLSVCVNFDFLNFLTHRQPHILHFTIFRTVYTIKSNTPV